MQLYRSTDATRLERLAGTQPRAMRHLAGAATSFDYNEPIKLELPAQLWSLAEEDHGQA
jgi:hypothetical protein